MGESHPFDCQLFESLVRERDLELGRGLLHYATTASTNDVVLRAMSEGAPHGLVVVADHQTAGRGRRGRTWLSQQPCENLLFTLLLRPQCTAENVSNVTLAIGLGVRDALQQHLDQTVGLKWINDILVNGRKLVGILVESQVRDADISLAVGIGLNVQMRDLPDEIRSIATSMSLLGARELRREHLLVDVLEHVQRRFEQWQSQGFASMAAEYRSYDAIMGSDVTVDGLQGRAVGVTNDGALLLQVGQEAAPRRLINGIVEFV